MTPRVPDQERREVVERLTEAERDELFEVASVNFAGSGPEWAAVLTLVERILADRLRPAQPEADEVEALRRLLHSLVCPDDPEVCCWGEDNAGDCSELTGLERGILAAGYTRAPAAQTGLVEALREFADECERLNAWLCHDEDIPGGGYRSRNRPAWSTLRALLGSATTGGEESVFQRFPDAFDERQRPVCGVWNPLLGPCICGNPEGHTDRPATTEDGA